MPAATSPATMLVMEAPTARKARDMPNIMPRCAGKVTLEIQAWQMGVMVPAPKTIRKRSGRRPSTQGVAVASGTPSQLKSTRGDIGSTSGRIAIANMVQAQNTPLNIPMKKDSNHRNMLIITVSKMQMAIMNMFMINLVIPALISCIRLLLNKFIQVNPVALII